MKGQAKIDFYTWLIINYYKGSKAVYSTKADLINDFNSMPLSMQYGVIVDWFDSAGIEICNITNGLDVYYLNNKGNLHKFKTRPQARQKAIDKAVEIYNNRFK